MYSVGDIKCMVKGLCATAAIASGAILGSCEVNEVAVAGVPTLTLDDGTLYNVTAPCITWCVI